MSEEENDDKQYEATQKKLDDARKKGEIARSADLNTALSYAGFTLAAILFGGEAIMTFATELMAFHAQVDEIAGAFAMRSGGAMIYAFVSSSTMVLAAFLALPIAMILAALVAQRGIIFAPSKLAPKLSRISPIAQAKNKFGRSGLFEFFKSFAKLLLYSAVLFFYLLVNLDRIIASSALGARPATLLMVELTVGLMFIVIAISAVLGGVDFVFQAAEHRRKNRMSHKEMMDEAKESEGDPMMKQQRRQKAMEIALNQMLADVPNADVVVVNPTHYAVALKWDRQSGKAPVCVAKGVDHVALRIREVANEHAVPIHSDPPTARSMHAVLELGDEIRPEHYKAVAAAIRFAEKLKLRRV